MYVCMYIYNIEHESLFDTITSAFKNPFNVIFIQGEAPLSLSKVSFLSKTETRLYTTDSQLVSSALPDSTLDEYMIVTEGGLVLQLCFVSHFKMAARWEFKFKKR